MKPPRLEHNRFIVENLQEVVDFYTNVLGFTISWRGEHPAGEDWVHLRSGDMYLSVSQGSGNCKNRVIPDGYDAMSGYEHMGWIVEDLKEYEEALKENKVELYKVETEVADHIYFYDPSNYQIELVQYKEESA